MERASAQQVTCIESGEILAKAGFALRSVRQSGGAFLLSHTGSGERQGSRAAARGMPGELMVDAGALASRPEELPHFLAAFRLRRRPYLLFNRSRDRQGTPPIRPASGGRTARRARRPYCACLPSADTGIIRN